MIDIAHGFIDLHKRDKSDSDYLIEWGHHSCSHMSKAPSDREILLAVYQCLVNGNYGDVEFSDADGHEVAESSSNCVECKIQIGSSECVYGHEEIFDFEYLSQLYSNKNEYQ